MRPATQIRVAYMSKHDPLRDHLVNLRRDEWTATFDQVEDILGFRLPYSARSHQAWWANEEIGNHSHARAWMNAGWRTSELNLTGETVVFRRDR